MISELNVPCDLKEVNITINVNNMSALNLAVDQRIASRTCHYHAKMHHFWSKVNKSHYDIVHCKASEMLADYLTKGLTYETFVYLRQKVPGQWQLQIRPKVFPRHNLLEGELGYITMDLSRWDRSRPFLQVFRIENLARPTESPSNVPCSANFHYMSKLFQRRLLFQELLASTYYVCFSSCILLYYVFWIVLFCQYLFSVGSERGPENSFFVILY